MSPRSLARVASSFDGLERISTQAVMFEVPQRQRAIGACRHLAGLMAELGWTAVCVRDVTLRGLKEQVAVMFAMRVPEFEHGTRQATTDGLTT